MTYSVDIFIGVRSVQEVSEFLYEVQMWDMVEDVQPFDNGVIVTTKDLDFYERTDLREVLMDEYGIGAVTEL